jgi:hypothetical protein
MYISISPGQTIRTNEIIAVISHQNYRPAAFVRLLVPIDKVKSFVVTDDFIYGTPLKAQSILKKVKEQRL